MLSIGLQKVMDADEPMLLMTRSDGVELDGFCLRYRGKGMSGI